MQRASASAQPAQASSTASGGAPAKPRSAAGVFLGRSFVSLCLATLLASTGAFVFTLLPLHVRALGMEEGRIGAIMGAFFLGTLLMMPVTARLVARFGCRAVVSGGLVVLALSCLVFLVVDTAPALLGARLLQGFGWSAILIGTTIAATLLAPPDRLAQGLGIYGSVFLLSQAVGPWAGEILLGLFGSFQAVFVAACVLAASALLLVGPLPPGSAPKGAPAAAGQGRPVAMMGLLLATFCLSSGFGAVMAFIADFVALSGIATVAPFFAGYIITGVAIRLVGGGYLDRFGRRTVILAGAGLQVASLGALAGLSAEWQLWPLGLAFGVASAIFAPALQALVVERGSDRARSVTLYNSVFLSGVVFASVSFGLLARATGYDMVYLSAAGLAGLAALLVAIAAAEPRRPPATTAPPS
ncbi:MFS transporter [Salinarimonas sp. NSM]|uniref:MFS transporter n=1 Tax=Salinarimonas sp. NSM TaxID=3458003 RepID=UPI004036F4CF